MSRRAVALFGGSILAGAGMGLAEAEKWLHTVSVPDSPAAASHWIAYGCVWLAALLMVLGLAAAGYAVALSVTPSRPGTTFVGGVARAAVAVGVCWVAATICAPFGFVQAWYVVTFACALAVSAGALFYITTPPVLRSLRESATRGGLVAVGWTAFLLCSRLASGDSGHPSFGGFAVFRALALPPELRVFPSLLQDLACGALFGGVAGVAASWILGRGRESRGAAWGAAAGVWISAVLYVVHSVAATAIMRSAYSEGAASCASLALGPAAGAIAATGVAAAIGFPRGRWRRTAAVMAALGALAVGAVYVVDSRAGADLYLAARSYQLYRTRVHIHFRAGGAWSRALERNADGEKIALCDRLLQRYPRCIYVPEALYLKAKSQFASWRFAEAARTLEDLRSRYRDSRGTSTRLLALCYLAMGRFGTVASGFGLGEWDFSAWRRGDGAQLIAHACEVVGQPERARGLYVQYIENLMGSSRGGWSTPAIHYAERRSSALMPGREAGIGRAAVRGRVMDEDRPLAGVQVALVQPHLDASSPDDSRQFMSALTLPLWFGLSGTTGAEGCFEMRNVPYGRYEVVIGFDAARIRAGRVISCGVPPVEVRRPEVRLAGIRFVPGVQPLSPLDGVATVPAPTLTWRTDPEAAYYSVLVVSRPNLAAPGVYDPAPRKGYTCWVRSHIRGAAVRVTTEGFDLAGGATDESRARSLIPGRRYMWMVLAYDKAGNVISSSEHYRLDHEPVFLIRSDDS